jgi:hypothetical protein
MPKNGQTVGSEQSSDKTVKFGEEGFGLPKSSWGKLNKNQGTEHLGEKPKD